jgi:hypothetical protein
MIVGEIKWVFYGRNILSSFIPEAITLEWVIIQGICPNGYDTNRGYVLKEEIFETKRDALDALAKRLKELMND